MTRIATIISLLLLVSVNSYGKSTFKGVREGVIDVSKVFPLKLADYIEGSKIAFGLDPLDDIGKHQLLRMMKSGDPTIKTVIKDDVGNVIREIEGVAVLKRGEHYFDPEEGVWKGFGWEHISKPRGDLPSHADEIKDALALPNNDEAVKDVIREVIEHGTVTNYIPGEAIEITKTVTRNGKSHDILVVISDRPKNIGSIQTAHPL